MLHYVDGLAYASTLDVLCLSWFHSNSLSGKKIFTLRAKDHIKILTSTNHEITRCFQTQHKLNSFDINFDWKQSVPESYILIYSFIITIMDTCINSMLIFSLTNKNYLNMKNPIIYNQTNVVIYYTIWLDQ